MITVLSGLLKKIKKILPNETAIIFFLPADLDIRPVGIYHKYQYHEGKNDVILFEIQQCRSLFLDISKNSLTRLYHCSPSKKNKKTVSRDTRNMNPAHH